MTSAERRVFPVARRLPSRHGRGQPGLPTALGPRSSRPISPLDDADQHLRAVEPNERHIAGALVGAGSGAASEDVARRGLDVAESDGGRGLQRDRSELAGSVVVTPV